MEHQIEPASWARIVPQCSAELWPKPSGSGVIQLTDVVACHSVYCVVRDRKSCSNFLYLCAPFIRQPQTCSPVTLFEFMGNAIGQIILRHASPFLTLTLGWHSEGPQVHYLMLRGHQSPQQVRLWEMEEVLIKHEILLPQKHCTVLKINQSINKNNVAFFPHFLLSIF